MAEATIYDVSTQVISSCVAFRLEAMWGRATFAMVVSSTCITVATMIDAVSNAGAATLTLGGVSAGAAGAAPEDAAALVT